jgi:hypothetical protein
MAIQCVDHRYIVTIKGFGRGRQVPLIGLAASREEARALEAEMIAVKRAGLPWPSSQPAKGTLAAALDEAWGRADGWHSKRCGPAHYATAFDFITEAGADSQASGITEKMIATFLANRPDATAAVFQLLEAMAEGGSVGWRPVTRKGQSDRCPIALLTAHETTRTKIVPVTNPTKSSGNRRDGPLWEMVEVKRKAWR